MNLLGTQYTLKYKAYEIYLSGCKAPHCPGCHSQDSWDFNAGTLLSEDKIKELVSDITNYSDLVDRIWVMGGEPTHQNRKELLEFLQAIRKIGKEMWLWTRQELKDLDSELLSYFDYAKCGRYKQELPGYTEDVLGITLASYNQKVYKL